MKLTTKQYAIALHQELAEAKASDHNDIMAKFIRLLAGKNRLSLLPQIIEQLQRHIRTENGVSLVQLTTAQAVPESVLKTIKKTLQEKLGTAIELETRVDAKILGGAIIQLDDTVINGSVAQSLNQLSTTLAQSGLNS